MTEHRCIEFDPNCYRCDLSRDEVEWLIAHEDELDEEEAEDDPQ